MAVVGSTIEAAVGLFANYGGQVPASQRGLLIYHPGLGNSLQATSATFTVTAQSGSVLTVQQTTANTPAGGIGVPIAGGGLVAGTQIVGFTANSVTVSPAPIGSVSSFVVQNDTAKIAWTNLIAYCTQATQVYGYTGIVLIGSASRGLFTTAQLSEFNTIKAFMRELWPTLPGCVGYIDWEDDPCFGSDGATMIVQSINGSNVTVQALSAYAAVGNRIRWDGMPVNVQANTGGQYITGVSGTTITVSGATTGLIVGEVIQAINPAPWSSSPGLRGPGLNIDRQHFSRDAYYREGATCASFVLNNALLTT